MFGMQSNKKIYYVTTWKNYLLNYLPLLLKKNVTYVANIKI